MAGCESKILKAKKCYGHLGGKLGERIFERMIELEWFKREEGGSTGYVITEKGFRELGNLGVRLD